jgi:hypothetical protein
MGPKSRWFKYFEGRHEHVWIRRIDDHRLDGDPAFDAVWGAAYVAAHGPAYRKMEEADRVLGDMLDQLVRDGWGCKPLPADYEPFPETS